MVDAINKTGELVVGRADETQSQAISNGSLKLKINLRDRQSIRKRHRSSSPSSNAGSSDSSLSTRSSSRHSLASSTALTVTQLPRTSAKRTRKEQHQPRLIADENDHALVHDTPPPSNGSPNKPEEISEPKKSSKDKNGMSRTAVQNANSVLLVDMNGDVPPEETAECSPPESPPPDNKEDVKTKDDKLKIMPEYLVKKLSREELERLVLEQMCMAIRERGVTGLLERKLENADMLLDRYRKRSEALQKQVTELELVVRRFVQQSKGRQPLAPPIKLTRSVGLQINMGQMYQQSNPSIMTVTAVPPSTSSATNKVSTATSPVKANITIAAATVTKAIHPLGSPPIRPSVSTNQPMQSADIASYVPQQAMPRYRTAQPVRKPDDGHVTVTSPPSAAPKLVNYVNIGQSASLLKNTSVHITPVLSNNQANRPPAQQQQQQHGSEQRMNSAAATILARARAATAEAALQSSLQQAQQQQAIARWAKVPASRTPASANAATVVNKVTLPGGRLPNVIDLTDEDLEKERAAAAAAGRISRPVQPTKPAVPASAVRGVAVKSTTLNGNRNLASNGRPANSLPQQPAASKPAPLTHPAPLPPTPVTPSDPSWKPMPGRPTLDIKRVSNGIVLSWNMEDTIGHAEIASYQLFAYQEGSDPPTVNGSVWKRVGDVKALPLPMACTLTQFLEGHRYHFAVRAMDVHKRAGPYSEPGTILLS